MIIYNKNKNIIFHDHHHHHHHQQQQQHHHFHHHFHINHHHHHHHHHHNHNPNPSIEGKILTRNHRFPSKSSKYGGVLAKIPSIIIMPIFRARTKPKPKQPVNFCALFFFVRHRESQPSPAPGNWASKICPGGKWIGWKPWKRYV